MIKNAPRISIALMIAVICLAGCSSASQPPAISLQEAALRGDVAAVRQHIKAGTDLNRQQVSDGSTPLITAAAFGQTEVAKALLEAGANPNIRNNDGSTALITAAFLCRADIVQLLLDYKADKSLKNNAGSTPLDSVSGPFEQVQGIYDVLQQVLGPLGLKLDYEYLKATRPTIAKMLR